MVMVYLEIFPAPAGNPRKRLVVLGAECVLVGSTELVDVSVQVVPILVAVVILLHMDLQVGNPRKRLVEQVEVCV